LGQSYESTLKELIAKNLITLLDTRGFEPKVISSWWNEAHFLEFHRCKGHLTNSCMQLKDKIQDLIGNKVIQIEESQANIDHGVFKNPLPNYDKGESSNMNGKGKGVIYVYDGTIYHISTVEDHTNNIEINNTPNPRQP